MASASTNFTYDAYGNLVERAVAGTDPTVYTYDLADRLVGFTPDGGDPVTYTLDAAGRRWTRSLDGILDATYTYHAAGNQVSRITAPGLTTDAAFDPAGTRLATATSASGFGWLLADLHGNAAATAAGDFSAIDNAFRYDPYGQLIDSVTDSLPTPWRFGGRLHLDPDGDTDLYDWQARAYDPGLGAFTSLDSVTGSVESPLTLNRYLFTHANPMSLIDPDGHCVHCGARFMDGAGNIDDRASYTLKLKTTNQTLRAVGATPLASTLGKKTPSASRPAGTPWDGARAAQEVVSSVEEAYSARRITVSEAARVLRVGGAEASAASAVLREAGRVTRPASLPGFKVAARGLGLLGVGLTLQGNLAEGQDLPEASVRTAISTGAAVGTSTAVGFAVCGTAAALTAGIGGVICGGAVIAGGFLGFEYGERVGDSLLGPRGDESTPPSGGGGSGSF